MRNFVTPASGGLLFFEVPTGAFPVPWNLSCLPGQVRTQDGECRNRTGIYGRKSLLGKVIRRK